MKFGHVVNLMVAVLASSPLVSPAFGDESGKCIIPQADAVTLNYGLDHVFDIQEALLSKGYTMGSTSGSSLIRLTIGTSWYYHSRVDRWVSATAKLTLPNGKVFEKKVKNRSFNVFSDDQRLLPTVIDAINDLPDCDELKSELASTSGNGPEVTSGASKDIEATSSARQMTASDLPSSAASTAR